MTAAERLMRRLDELQLRKQTYMMSVLDRLEKDVAGMEQRLFNMLYDSHISRLETSAGKVVFSVNNLKELKQIERIVSDFSNQHLALVNTKYGADMLRGMQYDVNYYKTFNPENRTMKVFNDIQQKMATSLGMQLVDKGGAGRVSVAGDWYEVAQGSYLDNITQIPEVKKELKDFVMNSLASGKPYEEYMRSFKQMIVGNENLDGRLTSYYRQFAFDTFNKVDAASNLQAADTLGMNYFVYAGSLIDNSREFCRKRAGRVYTREEADDWVNDPDLPGKNDTADYNPLIDRGRWNCRHRIRWVPDEIGEAMKKQQGETVPPKEPVTKEQPKEIVEEPTLVTEKEAEKIVPKESDVIAEGLTKDQIPEFKPAVTIEEAEKYTKMFANFADYSGRNLKEANAVNEWLSKNFVGEKLQAIFIEKGPRATKALAYYRPSSNTITLNVDKILNMQKLISKSEKFINKYNKLIKTLDKEIAALERAKQAGTMPINGDDILRDKQRTRQIYEMSIKNTESELNRMTRHNVSFKTDDVFAHEFGYKLHVRAHQLLDDDVYLFDKNYLFNEQLGGKWQPLSFAERAEYENVINWKPTQAYETKYDEKLIKMYKKRIKDGGYFTNKLDNETTLWAMRNVSEYAATNTGEFFAELYVKYLRGDSLPDKYVKVIEKIIEMNKRLKY